MPIMVKILKIQVKKLHHFIFCVEQFWELLPAPSQTLLCRFEGLGREAVQAEQPGFVIGGTGTETIYQQTKWRTWLFSICLSFDIIHFA